MPRDPETDPTRPGQEAIDLHRSLDVLKRAMDRAAEAEARADRLASERDFMEKRRDEAVARVEALTVEVTTAEAQLARAEGLAEAVEALESWADRMPRRWTGEGKNDPEFEWWLGRKEPFDRLRSLLPQPEKEGEDG